MLEFLMLAALTLQTPASRPEPVGVVQGEVLARDGQPAAGAQVRILAHSAWELPPTMVQHADEVEPIRVVGSVVTGADGRFRCAVPEGCTLAADAWHATLGRSAAVAGAAAGDTLVLRLVPVRRIQGKVLRTRGGKTEPAPDHPVWFQMVPDPLHAETPRGRDLRVCLHTRTAADGSYQLEVPDLGPESAVVWTRLDGQVLRGVDLMAQEPQAVSCQLVERDSGQPVAGARVLPAWGAGVVPAVSDAQGRITTVGSGSGQVQVVAPGHRRLLVDLRDLAPGPDRTPPRIPLDPGLQLRARLLRADRTPLADARVRLQAVIGEGNGRSSAVDWPEHTDAEGRLDLGCLQSATPLVGLVEVEGTWHVFHCGVVPGTRDLGDRIVTGTTRIAGQVVGPDGAPVPGAEVRLLAPRVQGNAQPPPVHVLSTNRLGQFAASGLPTGTWRVAAHAASFAMVVATCDSRTAAAPLRLVLAPGDRITGRVLSASDQTPVHARIDAWTPTVTADALAFGVTRWCVATDANGSFAVGGLPAGSALHLYVQTWRDPRTGSTEVQNVRAGTSDLEILLPCR